MLLESVGDHKFADMLNANLKTIATELKRSNDLEEGKINYNLLYKLVERISSEPIPENISDEYNRVLGDCQNLMESLERASDELGIRRT